MTQERQKCYDNVGYEPFDDRPAEPLKAQKQLLSENTEETIDTSQIDAYRQGVSIRSYRDKFIGNQPKIGSGHPCHFTDVQVYGQSRDYTHYTNTSVYLDDVVKFDPVEFISKGSNYPLPIELSGGPKEREEASVEPLTIPFKKSSVVEPYIARQIHGNYETGNEDIEPGNGNDEVSQLITYEAAPVPHYYLDDGNEPIPFKYIIGDINFDIANPLDAYITYPMDGYAGSLINSNQELLGYFKDGTTSSSLSFVNSAYPDFPLESKDFGIGPFINAAPVNFAENGSDYRNTQNSTVINDFWRLNNFSFDIWIKFIISGYSGFYNYTYPITFQDSEGYLFYIERFAYDTDSTPFVQVLIQTHGFDGFLAKFDSSAGVLDTFRINQDGWNHLCCTYASDDGTNFEGKIYVNGVEFHTDTWVNSTLTSPSPDPSGNFFQFNDGNNNGAWNHSFRMYDRTLTASEVSSLYSTSYGNEKYSNFKTNDIHYVPNYDRRIIPYDDRRDESIVDQLNTTNSDFISAVRALDMDLSEDLRKDFSHKSATAGTTVYGGDAARYGTDSIAFANLFKGASSIDNSPVELLDWSTDLTFARATEATYLYDDTVLIYAVNTPRIITDAETFYYNEGARTNLFDFHDQQTSLANATVNSNISDPVAPDGTTSAEQRTVTADGGYIAQTHTVGIAEHVYSVMAQLMSGEPVNFLQVTGAGGTYSSVYFTAINKWTRYESIGTHGVSGSHTLRVVEDDSPNNSSLAVWGWQSEEAGFSSQIIRTSGSPTTRDADDAYVASANVPEQMKSGRFSVVIKPRRASSQTPDESTETIFSFAAGTDDRIYIDATTQQIRVRQGAVTRVSSNVLTWSAEQYIKLTFDATAGTVSVEGATTGDGEVTGSSWTMPSNDMRVGNISGLNRPFFGHIGEPKTVV